MAVHASPQPPSWLSKAEKTTFRHVVAARNAIDRPVTIAERDTVADYSAARRRIVELRQVAAAASFADDKIKAANAVAAATKLARTLAKDLGLVGSAAE